MPRLRTTLLAATLLAGAAGAAVAQMAAGTTFDPQQLPATKGRVAAYSLTPRGDVDGLLLEDGTEVHLPPHLGAQLAFAVQPGDAVTVHGLKARAVPVVQAMSVTNDASNQTVVDAGPTGGPIGGPRGHHGGGQPMEAQGRVKAQLYGRQGEVNGVLLEDGTQIHLPPPEAQRLAAQLATGQTVFVRGNGTASPLGRVIGARAVGPDRTQLVQVAAPPPHGGPGKGPGHDRRGPPPPPPGGPDGAAGPGAAPPAPAQR